MAISANSRRLDADLLTRQEIEALIRACPHRAPTGLRNQALIALAWRSGLRISEVLALRPKDLDPESGTLVVQHGKGDKTRRVGIDAGTVALVNRWLEQRRKLGIPAGRPLICTLDGGTIDPSLCAPLAPAPSPKGGDRKARPRPRAPARIRGRA